MPYSIHTAHMPCLSKICPVNTMFIKYLVDPDLRVDIFFKKNGTTGKRDIDFEIWD